MDYHTTNSNVIWTLRLIFDEICTNHFTTLSPPFISMNPNITTFQLQGLCLFEPCRWRGLGGRAWGGVCRGGLGRKWVGMSANDGFSTTVVEA